MTKLLQNIIDGYNNGLLERDNLQIRNEIFQNETICEEYLEGSTFRDLSLINVNFTKVNFDSSHFYDCLFKDCIFESTIFAAANFENSRLTNCRLRNSNLTKVEFIENFLVLILNLMYNLIL